VACFGAAPQSIFAQQLGALQAGVHRPESGLSYPADPVHFDVAEGSREVPRWPFVLGGALVGGAAAGGWYAYESSKTDDATINFFGPFVAAGTVAGALVGLIVCEIVRGIQDAPPNNKSQKR
jgi:hypothetical protein